MLFTESLYHRTIQSVVSNWCLGIHLSQKKLVLSLCRRILAQLSWGRSTVSWSKQVCCEPCANRRRDFSARLSFNRVNGRSAPRNLPAAPVASWSGDEFDLTFRQLELHLLCASAANSRCAILMKASSSAGNRSVPVTAQCNVSCKWWPVSSWLLVVTRSESVSGSAAGCLTQSTIESWWLFGTQKP